MQVLHDIEVREPSLWRWMSGLEGATDASVPAFALEVSGNPCESSVMMHLLQVGN